MSVKGPDITRTVMGQENEMAFAAIGRAGERLPRRKFLERVRRNLWKEFRCLPGPDGFGVFLANGGRLYVDHGEHPEWCTPECGSPAQVVAYRAAGEHILEHVVTRTERESPEASEIVLSRSNVDYVSRTTWAGHENYLVWSPVVEHEEHLVPHLVSRIIFTGSGGLDPKMLGIEFMLSPRVAFLCRQRARHTTGDRGIFHAKNETLSAGPHHRLHVICGENLMSEVADFLRMGTTALVSCLIDLGERPGRSVRLADPLSAMQVFARDIECSRTVRLANGRRTTALRIQRHYLEQVQKALRRGALPPWADGVCQVWSEVLDRLENDPASLNTVLDWKIKKTLFDGHMRRAAMDVEGADDLQLLLSEHHHSLDEGTSLVPGRGHHTGGQSPKEKQAGDIKAELAEIDSTYGRVGARGLFNHLDRRGLLSHRVLPADDAVRAMTAAPPGRAAVRGEIIRQHGTRTEPNGEYRCNWMSIIDLVRKRRMDLGDPFMTQHGAWTHLPGREVVFDFLGCE